MLSSDTARRTLGVIRIVNGGLGLLAPEFLLNRLGVDTTTDHSRRAHARSIAHRQGARPRGHDARPDPGLGPPPAALGAAEPCRSARRAATGEPLRHLRGNSSGCADASTG